MISSIFGKYSVPVSEKLESCVFPHLWKTWYYPSLEDFLLPLSGKLDIPHIWKILFPVLWKSWYPHYVATVPPYIFFRGPLLHTIDLNIGVTSEFR
jgi:hypothetical protein